MSDATIGRSREWSRHLVGAAFAIVYIATASPYIVDGDNAEFAALAGVDGAAHPSGYPLYLLWLRATAWLPGSSVAHTAAIATAILGAAGVWVVHAACRAWGARPLPATIAAGLYGAAPVIAGIATSAEVFALNQLAVALILWLAARGGPVRGARRTIILALVAGLGLSNHMTCALLAPIGILGVVRGLRETQANKAVVIAAALGVFALGFVPYLYLLAAPHAGLGWGHPQSLHDLGWHLLRMDYGGPTAFAGTPDGVDVLGNLRVLAGTLGRGWLYVPLAGALVFLGAKLAKRQWDWALLALVFVIAGPVLAARFDIPPVGLGVYVARRFHLLPLLVLAPAVAGALDALGAHLVKKLPMPARGRTIIAGAIVAGATAASLPHLAAVHSPATQTGIANLLRALPPNAIVVHAQDLLLFGGGYVQIREGIRPDVTLVQWTTLKLPWYRARIAAQAGVPLDDTKVDSVAFVEAALAAGHPVFVDNSQGNIVRALPSYPFATVFRILPRGTRQPPIETVFAENKAAFERFELGYELPGPDDDFATDTHERYAATWTIIAEALARSGKLEDAAAAQAIARGIGPQP